MNVHLASCENPEWAFILEDLNYRFRLGSYYYMQKHNPDTIKMLVDMSNSGLSSWILDSGLFSLMFGSEKGKLTTYDQYRDYALKYRESVERWGWTQPIVECDVQRVLGVDETLRIREEVFGDYPHEVIYVWHIPEGIEGLKELAKNRSYIAISVPELRAVYKSPSTGGPRVKRAIVELLSVIKSAGSPKVHLLGCTEASLLKLPAYSADSTSWYSSGRFGNAYFIERSELKGASIYSPKYQAWREYIVNHDRWSAGFAKNATRRPGDGPASDYFRNMGVGAATFQILMDIVNQ